MGLLLAAVLLMIGTGGALLFGLVRFTHSADRAAVYTTVAASSIALLGAAGASLGLYLMQRERLLAELRAARTRLAAVVATVPGGMSPFDKQGTIESFSAAAEGMFQLSAAEAGGRKIWSLFSDRAARALEALIAQSQPSASAA